ncbi:DUF2852 domain-containing protein [Aestuariivirga sp.]|uniref:DUF2852 domain-containing protein n=1 Tax=Aestuariivirga sp. TaxID=2650926 RepID=UPI00391D1D44
MTNTASAGFEPRTETRERRCGGTLSRWSAWEIGAMVAGFVVFWPLGLIAIFLKWKNGEMWRGSAEGGAPWSGFKAGSFKAPDFSSWRSHASSYGFASSGNAAFDSYKREQLARLEEERRKLEEDQKAFREFVEKVRRAKDQEEFDRFMAERNVPRA